MTGWRPEWASITDPLTRFRAMGSALDRYQAQNLGEMPMAGADDSAWADYTGRKQALQDAWLKTLSPTELAQWNKDSEFSAQQNRKHFNTGMGITGALIGLGAGGMALGQLGLLGGAAEAAPWASGAAVEGGAGGALEAANAAGLGGAGAGGAGAAAGFGGPLEAANAAQWGGAGAAAAKSGGLLGGLGSIGSAAGGVLDWMKANPGLTSLLTGALATAGSKSGGSSNTPQQQTFAPQPGLTIAPLVQQQQGGFGGAFTPSKLPAYGNSGLARFGAFGGTYQPNQPIPAIWRR